MATEKLIRASDARKAILKADPKLAYCIESIPGVDATIIPCKIGDPAWVIKNFGGVLIPKQGNVSEMFFTWDMRLMIVVKNQARGEWGKQVFATYEDAERRCRDGK